VKVYKPKEPIPETEKFAYITAKEGHYLLKRNGFFDACVKVDSIPGLPAQEEYFVLKAPDKIPLALLRQALAFMEKVYETHKSEALVLLTHDNNEWGLHVPEQTVSSVRVEYTNDEKRRVVGSIHSHPGFSSTPSGIDENDELDFDGIHVVTSCFQPVPGGITVFAVVNGRRFPLPPENLIEGLRCEPVTFPGEWLDKVKPQPPTSVNGFLLGSGYAQDAVENDDEDEYGLWEREDAFPESKGGAR
jgi:proteasome lid subunit RPN8/RPN11